MQSQTSITGRLQSTTTIKERNKIFCPKCGTKNEEKAKFCKKCVENLKNFTNSVITSEKKDENSKTVFGRKKLDYNKLAIILVIGIAVVILIGVIITYVDAHPDVGTY